MKKSYKIMIIIFIMLSFNKIYASNTIEKGFNVLVLNSYDQRHYWETNILKGLKDTIEQNDEKGINLNLEYLDFRNKNDEEYIKSLKEMLEAKYPKGSIDAIYTVDDEAYEAFRGQVLNVDSEFYKIPLVFSGVDNKVDGNDDEKEYMTGIYHRDDSLDLFKLIQRLNPTMDTINLIIENSLYCDSVKSEIDKLSKEYLKDHVKIRYIRSDYIEDISEQLDKIQYNSNTVNIIAGEFQHKYSKKYLNPTVVIDTIKKHNNSPIYSNDQTYIDAGIVGGHIDIGQEHGEIIANMLIKIKNGKMVSQIPNDIEPKAKAYIDYDSIYYYKINPLYVNDEVNWINKKPYDLVIPTWQKHFIRVTLIAILIGFAIVIKFMIKYKKEKILQKQEQEKAKERANLKTDFIVNLSHELRTPINIILGTSKVLECNIKKEDFDGNDILDKLDNIKQNSYRLLKISNNIIDITKAESGMLKLKLENCNIVEITEDIFTSTIDFAKRKNINMIFDTDTEELNLAIDIFQIQRVILNLLSNAIKYTNEGGEISIHISKYNKEALIKVKDNGIGIPEENIKHIFHRFYQVDDLFTRKSEGSGIGLCIAKDIVEIHGGRIEVESEVGMGSTFKVYIPIKTIDKYTQHDNQKILDINRIVDLEMSDI